MLKQKEPKLLLFKMNKDSMDFTQVEVKEMNSLVNVSEKMKEEAKEQDTVAIRIGRSPWKMNSFVLKNYLK